MSQRSRESPRRAIRLPGESAVGISPPVTANRRPGPETGSAPVLSTAIEHCSPGRSRTYVANPDSKSGGPCRQTNRGSAIGLLLGEQESTAGTSVRITGQPRILSQSARSAGTASTTPPPRQRRFRASSTSFRVASARLCPWPPDLVTTAFHLTTENPCAHGDPRGCGCAAPNGASN